ncbi:DUF1203 domain-containing protein [Kribbella solani]|uniref:DUF1203 domain-containing protein n=1 Tax=Kribbella solani TaxID=236067 RepID=UPI0029AF57E3|nr:DUF1203 domain-containing protein [Kribbella solani]MDX2970152.1 DUF1203 domain-containing protein [Kribbella solani]
MNAELRYEGVPGSALDRIRCNRHDDSGNSVVPRRSQGGEPLRCCLTIAAAGAEIALVAYRPMAVGGPYAEVGPVFVHTLDCPEPDTGSFPIDFRDRRAVLRPYDANGQMLDGVLAEAGTAETELKRLFEDAAVDSVQVRNVVAGCWNFTVRRQG